MSTITPMSPLVSMVAMGEMGDMILGQEVEMRLD